ncbi:MBL fold metallo-hydrolase [Granulicella sp. WH15]|uniref:MBL fold metallo-hydrolase n=1 Tax=Granulicella sp. WH15 TaxID=2602070 RepID=UPI001366C11A|nr:MBL fold metallo-hydrolase [Granulicella sp. WH15]QHN04660.1 MBL fold metallo-hydrolase [Granulicella sp. WH15]
MAGIRRVSKLRQLVRLVRESHAVPMTGEPKLPGAIGPGELGVTFLGHSSFLLRLAGRAVLVDPVFAKRLVVLRRARRVGVEMENLPPIDVVLLSHAHMDHLNRPTLKQVARQTRLQTGRAPVAVVPRGVEDLVDTLGFAEVRTLDRWESTTVAGLRVTLTPAKHWGARIFSDTHRGFGGYVIEGEGHRVYHSGDTAYFDGFREIGRRLHPQVALVPIGAYFPDTHRSVHTSPEEALDGFVDLGADVMVAMHFGTFRLGREPMEEPPIRLMADARRRGLESRVRVLGEGETLVVAPVAGDVLAEPASNIA